MNWIKQINNKVEERWINSSYEFKCNLSEIFFLGIFAVWLILTYSWTTMAHIPWPPFFYFCVQIGIGLEVLFRYMYIFISGMTGHSIRFQSALQQVMSMLERS